MASLPEEIKGTWELDKAQSDDTDAMLTAQGVGWAKRKLIGASGMTMHISETDGKILIKQETTFTTKDNEWEVGKETDIENPVVGKAKATLTIDGNKIVVVMKADGGVTTVNRWVDNGVMINETIFEPKAGGEKATMKRVFVRKA